MKWLISFICLLTFNIWSQSDSLKKPVHPYKKSMIYSAILPGAGQIRNSLLSQKKFKNAYWKIPLIYGSLVTSSIFIYNNHNIQNEIKNEYYSRMDGNPPSLNWSNYDNYGLISLQKQYLNNRDMFILLTLAIYGIQIIDAGVEAHFLNFDISDDLSLQIRPMLSNSVTGMGVKLNFR